jgi:hypothetical protein
MNWPFPRVLFYQLLSTIIVWYSMIYHSHSSCPLCLPRHCIWVVANSELCSVCAYVLSIAVDGYGMGYYKPELTCDRKTIRWLFLSMDFHFEIVKLWDCYHRNHRIFIFFCGGTPSMVRYVWLGCCSFSFGNLLASCAEMPPWSQRKKARMSNHPAPPAHFTFSATLKKGQVCQVRSFPQS